MTPNVPVFTHARVIVVGDVMLDRYWSGATERLSPEAPVPVVQVQDEKHLPGGAANVALNLAALGIKVALFGLIGDDEPGRLLQSVLEAANIECHLLKIDDYPTITKLRVMGRHQQLLRLDFEKKFSWDAAEKLTQSVQKHMSSADAVVLSDYAKGALQHAQQLIAMAKLSGLPVVVDPKTPTFATYKGATVLTPNLKEMQCVVGDVADEATLTKKAMAEVIANDLQAMLVTRSEKGVLLVTRTGDPVSIPTRAQAVFDVTGAGDTVVAVLAAALAVKQAMVDAARLANIAAGISVAKVGAATVSKAELLHAVHKLSAARGGVVSASDLQALIADGQAQGQKMVFTNGCFDVLHSGHVQYLEEAKQQGDQLVVAVNDDESVKRLKGETRPINTLKERMSVLAGLASVDWVVSFSEDTPAELIASLKPDVLVKGGDYQVHEIAGSDFVLANGGEVKILSFKEGVSTSAVVEKILTQKSLAESAS